MFYICKKLKRRKIVKLNTQYSTLNLINLCYCCYQSECSDFLSWQSVFIKTASISLCRVDQSCLSTPQNKADTTMLNPNKTTLRGRVEFMRLDTPEIRAQIHALSKLDNSQGFIRLGGDYAVWILAAIVAIRYPYLYPLSLIIIGSRMRAIENLMHETAHFTMFENRFLNDAIGTWLTAFGVFCTNPRKEGISIFIYSN
jgi:hypothetical protein